MTAHQVLESVARGMVAAGLYENVASAIRAMALEHIERKIAAYSEQVHEFEQKYQHDLDEHSRLLEGRATVEKTSGWSGRELP